LARRLLRGPTFCKSLRINDLRKEGPHSKTHAKDPLFGDFQPKIPVPIP
jgi:hypothetical protein